MRNLGFLIKQNKGQSRTSPCLFCTQSPRPELKQTWLLDDKRIRQSKTHPHPPTPVAQTLSLVGMAINQVLAPTPCSQKSLGSLHSLTGWLVRQHPPPPTPHPGSLGTLCAQEQELLIGPPLPFQMESPPFKGGKAAVMNS